MSKDPKHKMHLTIETEDLAVPEIHTGEVEEKKETANEEEIQYDTLAMPEIHIRKMEHKE